MCSQVYLYLKAALLMTALSFSRSLFCAGVCRWPGRALCPALCTWPGWRRCLRTCRPSSWCAETTRVSSPSTLKHAHREENPCFFKSLTSISASGAEPHTHPRSSPNLKVHHIHSRDSRKHTATDGNNAGNMNKDEGSDDG